MKLTFTIEGSQGRHYLDPVHLTRATFPFTKGPSSLFVFLFVCPSTFLETVHSTVTISDTFVK